jgi:hypothetical protein
MSTYNFEYTSDNGISEPITLREWAFQTLPSDEFEKFNNAMIRQSTFKKDIANFCKEYTTYISDNMSQIIDPALLADINETVLYRIYNFVGAFVQSEFNKAAKMFNVSLELIDETLLSRYKHNLMARGIMKQITWYNRDIDAEGRQRKLAVDNIILFDGTPGHAKELGLDLIYLDLFEAPMEFPDPDWEKYWDQFLADPHIKVVL